MCGIFAAVNVKELFDVEDFRGFERLTKITDYRGPDSHGIITINTFLGNTDKNNFNIFLGHNRLSIIDLSKEGNQPIQDDGIFIIYNGEIFNYIELRNSLMQDGVIFKTKTDTEVIIKIYNKYGEKGFQYLNGMWAFIIVDMNKNKVVVSRDRFSMKPLFFFNNNSKFYFASEIKQLLPLLSEKTINEKVMYKFLQQGLLDINDDTFFNGIKRIKPKSNFIIDLNKNITNSEEYWDYQIDDINEENYLGRFKDLLYDSVNIRLRSDVEVGALLSGGLDSSAVSLAAHELTGEKIRTFSVVSNDKRSSEEKFVDLMISEKGVNNTKIFIEHTDILKNLDKVIYHQDEPFTTLSIVAQYTILEMIKKNGGITVVLSGQGGDEILMGYLKYYFFYLKNLYNERKFSRLFQELILSAISRTVLFQNDIKLSKRYIPFLAREQNHYLKIRGELEKYWECENLVDRQKLDIDKYSVPVLARYEDRNSMAHSIETRLPFLDHRLVNFMLSIKTDLKIKNGWTKYIMRKSLTDLPHEIRWRRDKKGFTIPEEIWYKSELKNQVLSLFQNSMLDQMRIINKDSFLQYYKSFLNGNKKIHYSDISKVFIAEKWARSFWA